MNTNPVFRNNRPKPPVYRENDYFILLESPPVGMTDEQFVESQIQNCLVSGSGCFPPEGKSEGVPFRGNLVDRGPYKEFVRVYDDSPAEVEYNVDPVPGTFFHHGNHGDGKYFERRDDGKLVVSFHFGVQPTVWQKQ